MKIGFHQKIKAVFENTGQSHTLICLKANPADKGA